VRPFATGRIASCGKRRARLGLDVDLQHFALALPRALLALAPRLFEGSAQILDQLVLLLEPEVLLLGQALLLGVDGARDFEVGLAVAVSLAKLIAERFAERAAVAGAESTGPCIDGFFVNCRRTSD
jgi:hypothetical protein